ncbi:GDSL-type esterase/lipase family protein [Desulfosarcina sp.]|uniref:SGNH/GDSL hydrolase family protein n=1 Tax=Desulfosarcina sp. TaxID=2027861 RepID=UPI00356380CE
MTGCGGGGGDGTLQSTNVPPVADAGADQFTYDAAVVILAGTALDTDGIVQSQQWEQTGGTTVLLDDPTRSDPSFTAPSATGTLTFSYTVTDDAGAQHTDTVAVYVSEVLFSDSFDGSSSLASWTFVDDTGNTPSWQVSLGELYQSENVATSPFLTTYHRGTFAYLNGSAFTGSTSFRFSVDITPRTNNGGTRDGNDVGIMFPYNATTYYRLSMNSRFGFTRLERKNGTGFTTLAVNSIGYIEGQPMTLTVEVNQDTIMVWIDDDDPLFVESNLSISPGTVALYCQDSVSFDNVVISENSPQPMVAVASPLAHSIALTRDDGDALTVEAVVLNPPVGSQVVFSLDGGAETSATVVSGNRYTTLFPAVATGEHEIAAILKDAQNQEVHRDTNTVVGVGGDYFIAVGDSITDGIGDENPNNNFSMDGRIVARQGFEAPLSDELMDAGSPPRIVFNEGVPGAHAADLDGDPIDAILERHPRANAMLLLIGTNDAPDNISADAYESSVRNIVNTALTDVARAHIALIPPRYDDAGNLEFDTLIQGYNGRIALIAATSDNVYLGPDLYAAFLGEYNNSNLYTPPDGIHPNDAGYQVMAEDWATILLATP